MNFIDIILGILLLWGLIKGIGKGLFGSVASLLALVVGIYVAVHFSKFIAGAIELYVDWPINLVNIAAFAVTFIIVVLVVSVAGKLLTEIADYASLGIANKILGGVFGIVKMAFLASVLIIFVNAINDKIPIIKKETLDSSLLYRPVQKFAPLILPSFLKQKEPENKEASEA